MNKAKLKFNFTVIVLLAIICLLFGSIISSFISPSKAFALTNTNSATPVGDSAELYDINTGLFNISVVKDLQDKLFKDVTNPINYIKSMKDGDTNSYVIPASTINEKVGNKTDGMVVTLGGKEWMVASLTLTDEEMYGEEDIVVTLYLANPDGELQFWTDDSSTQGNNAYSRSIVRNHLINDSKWKLFNQIEEYSFASQYLIQPKYIKYQHYETCEGRVMPLTNSHMYNDALSDKKINGSNFNWYSGKYLSSDEYLNQDGESCRYDAWGNDYIWLPSVTETGFTDYGATASIWKLHNNQRASNSSNFLRSGSGGAYFHIYWMDMLGKAAGGNVTKIQGIRPAIHLNLTEVLNFVNVQSSYLSNPQDLTTTYNTKEQTIKSIATETKATWYTNDIYEHVDNYIKITYSNGANGVTNAGECWVKTEITNNYINAIYKQVEDEGMANNWSEDYIAQMKEIRKPRFVGTADTSDPEHMESDTVRWIKITINQADIDFSNVKWSASELEYNAAIQKVTIVSGLPSYVTAPIYSNNSEKNVNADGTFYTASLAGFTCTDSNYKVPTSAELAKIPQLQHNWKITKKQIEVSWIREQVTIGDLTLSIPTLQIADNLKSAIEYKYYRNSNLSDEVTLEQIFKENDISEEKPYLVVAKLNSAGVFSSENCVLVYQNATVESVETVFQTGSTINKVEVSLETNKFTYNGFEQKATFNVTGGGLTANDLVVTYKTEDGQILSAPPINVGRYKVAVALSDGLTDFDIVGQSEFDIEIQSLRIQKPLASQVQYFESNGFDLSQVANMPSDWENYFEIKVFDKDGNPILPQNGNWKFVNANKYKIEIHFKNGVNIGNGGDTDNVIWSDNDTSTYTVNLEIMPLEFVFEGWGENTGNKKPVVLGDVEEIEKYFDYVIYEIKNNIIIGNELPQNTTLKYNTNYQISLRVKAEYKGNVYLICNDDKIDETSVYKFKTEINPNPGGGDSSGDGDGDGNGDNSGIGGNNGNNTNSGTDLWFGTNGKLPIFAWILVGSNLLTILLLVLLVIPLLRKNKDREKFARVQPTESVTKKSNVQADNGEKNAYVNGSLMTDKDWTFIVREKDVLNIKALENQTERVLMYACRESEVKKLKKFQNELAEGNQQPETDTQDNKKKKKRR